MPHTRLLGFTDPFEDLLEDVFDDDRMMLSPSMPWNIGLPSPTHAAASTVASQEGQTNGIGVGEAAESKKESKRHKTGKGSKAADASGESTAVSAPSSSSSSSTQLTDPLAANQSWLANYARAPTVDVIDREKEYQINVDVPGVRKEDIKVQVSEQPTGRGQKRRFLTVSGERKDERTEGDDKSGYRATSSMYGKFSRSLTLPEDAITEGVVAKHDNGVLKITLPKTEPPKQPEPVVVKID